MSKFWNIDHPVTPRITLEDAELNVRPGETVQACWERLNLLRDEMLEREKEDPLKWGYEPEIWKITDAIIEWPWIDPAWAAAERARFGIPKAASEVLINGGYRGSKTEYMGKRIVQLMLIKPGVRVWCFITSIQQSIEVQQRVLAKYLPAPYGRIDIRSKTAYCVYKEATGFSENRFMLKNSSFCGCRTFNQQEDNVEGAAPDVVWLDEPPDPGLVLALKGRIAEKNGKLIMTFAPKHGYAGVVKNYVEDGEVTAESTAYLLPKDGGAPDIEEQLHCGLRIEECGLKP